MTQLFSISPDPPCKGQDLTITYTGTPPVNITTAIDGGAPSRHTIADDTGVTISVPSNAVSINIHDESGASDDLDVATVTC